MEHLPELLKSPAVIWFLIGLVFLLAEFVLPGLIILFFGIGCWFTSLSLLIMPDLGLNAQLCIFLISSVVSLALLRGSLKKWIDKKDKTHVSDEDEYLNKHCMVKEKIEPTEPGKVSFKGAMWAAESQHTIQKGDTCIIVGIDGIRLKVEPLNQN